MPNATRHLKHLYQVVYFSFTIVTKHQNKQIRLDPEFCANAIQ